MVCFVNQKMRESSNEGPVHRFGRRVDSTGSRYDNIAGSYEVGGIFFAVESARDSSYSWPERARPDYPFLLKNTERLELRRELLP